MNLKKKVVDSGRSITFLAKKARISRPLMSQYVNDARPIPDRVLEKIAPLIEPESDGNQSIAAEPSTRYGM